MYFILKFGMDIFPLYLCAEVSIHIFVISFICNALQTHMPSLNE